MTTCHAGDRCAYFDHILAQPADTEHPLCVGCLDRAALAVRALPLDYRDLEQHIPPILGQWGDGQPGHSGEAPIPIRIGIEALQREIWWITTTWAEILADHYQLSDAPTRVRDGYAVNWAVGLLRHRLDVLARVDPVELADYPWTDDDTTRYGCIEVSTVPGWQGVLDLARLHDRARVALGLTSLTRHLPGTCRSRGCGRPELYQDNGSDTVWCGHCGNATTRDDYDRDSNLFERRAA